MGKISLKYSDWEGNNCLHIACKHGNRVRIGNTFIRDSRAAIHLNEQNLYGETPCHILAKRKDIPQRSISFLMGLFVRIGGANLFIFDQHRVTAFELLPKETRKELYKAVYHLYYPLFIEIDSFQVPFLPPEAVLV